MKTTKSVLTVTIAFLFSGGSPVFGQNAIVKSKLDGSVNTRQIEEVLVTVTKKGRAENLQDVPIAISALNANQLDAMQFESIVDIGHSFPNATLQESYFIPGQAQFFIRGVGVNHTAMSVDPSVGVTINGMALGMSIGMVTDSFDLESLEILRGPQGTLFGRNVTGGVVALRTKRPTGEFGFEAQGTLGSYDRQDFAVGIENALIEDKLAGRLAIMYKDRDGYFKNLQGGRIGEARTRIIRPTLVFTPSDTLDITLFTEYGKVDAGMPALRNLYDPRSAYSALYTPPSDDLQVFDLDFEGPNYNEWQHAIGEVNWDVGLGRFTSVTAYRELKMVVSTDFDGAGAPEIGINFLPNRNEQRQLSQEIRYAVDFNERVNLTAGLYYFDQSYQNSYTLEVFGGLDYRMSFADHKAYALFAQGEITLAENWVLTLGGRYGKENKDFLYATRAGGGCEPAPGNPRIQAKWPVNCNYDFEDSESWNNFSPKVGLQWLINDTTQAYASWTKGFKSGGYNGEATEPAGAGPYDEETVEGFEIGLKTDLLDGRMRLNLAAFLNDYTGMQRLINITDLSGEDPVFINTIANAGSSEVMGIEAEFNYLVTEHLSLSGNLGLMRSDIKEFDGLDIDRDGIPDPELAKKNELARVPEVTYALGLTYEIPLSLGNINLRSDYSFTGERPSLDDNVAILDSYRSLNLSASFATHDDRYRISLFGKNMLNDTARLYTVTAQGFFTAAQISPPRTWGVEFKYNF